MGAQAIANSGADVVSLVKSQHEQIRELFGKVLASRGLPRMQMFTALSRLLLIHEVGEAAIVHPVSTRAIVGGEGLVARMLRDEGSAKTRLEHLGTLDLESDAFDTTLRVLQTDVLAHIKNEETYELPQLAAHLAPERLAKMRKALELSESAVAADLANALGLSPHHQARTSNASMSK